MTTILQTTTAIDNGSGGGVKTVSLAGVAPGDVLILTVTINNTTPSSVTTTAGSTSAWAVLFSADNGSPFGAVVAVYMATALSASVTAQIMYTTGSVGQFGLLEVAGLSTTADGTNSGSGSGGTTAPTGSLTPTVLNDLAIAVAYSTSGNMSAGPGGSWTNLGITGALGFGGLTAYQVLPNTSAVSATFTHGGFLWEAAIVLVQPGGHNIVMIA